MRDTVTVTHEAYLAAIVEAIAAHAPQYADRIRHARVMFGTGVGRPGVLGTTFYGTWKNGQPDALPVIEICAFAQDTPSQIAVTTVHEIAHAVLDPGAGHGSLWKATARELGMATPSATSSGCEGWDAFDPDIRAVLEDIPTPNDGKPFPPSPRTLQGRPIGPRPCSAGNGARGGTSRGRGAGSRMFKCTCHHEDCGYTVRTTRKWLDVGAPICPIPGHGPMAPDDPRGRP